MGSKDLRKHNYRIFIVANSIGAIFGGLSIPFFLAFIFEFGASTFGTALAVQGIFAAVVAYYAGKYSDKMGRKPMLIGSSIAMGIIVLFYAFATKAWHLVVLQAFLGVLTSIYTLTEQVFMADITEQNSRGRDIGKYVMILGILTSIFTLIGGFLLDIISFRVMFIFLAIISILDTIPYFFLKEK